LVNEQAFRRAVVNITTWGDTDVFPFPVENHILHDLKDNVVVHLSEMCRNFSNEVIAKPIHNFSTLAPVGYTGFRWATQIDTVWNAYLLGLVISLAPHIEAARLPESAGHVYSYRFQDDDTSESLFNESAWLGFQEQTRTLAERHEYVVSVDVADFYSRIYHHRLENALRPTDPTKEKLY